MICRQIQYPKSMNDVEKAYVAHLSRLTGISLQPWESGGYSTLLSTSMVEDMDEESHSRLISKVRKSDPSRLYVDYDRTQRTANLIFS